MSKTSKRYLSEDLSAKKVDQKRRNIAYKKKVRYWKFKAAEEKNMKNITIDADCDLTAMFKEVDKPEN